MIGKAIHTILKDKISELNDGKVYPIILPQNANHRISSSQNYPAVIYHQYNEYNVSKDNQANMIYSRVMLQVIGKTYKDMDSISNKIREVLDHYKDLSTDGLVNVPGYTSQGYPHSFIKNVDISHIFYMDENDEYFDKLNLFTRRLEYDVYYYNDILQLSYDLKSSNNKTPTNPLIFSLDFTEKQIMITNSINKVSKVFNKLGRTTVVNQVSSTISTHTMSEFIEQSSGLTQFLPTYNDGTSDNTKAFVEFTGTNTLNFKRFDNSNTKLHTPYGSMIVLVYRPTGENSNNFLLGKSNEATDRSPMCISHKKVGSNISISFNPNGSFSGASRERTLITSTDSSKYWGGDYHFLCLSLGGSKDYTGGSVNQAGWFEYFNSDYNPNLTTGQILKNNTITGNTDDMSNDADQFYISRVGSTSTSAGFRMYEMLVFIPNQAQTHNINSDAAPFQPTDIIYKKVKDYILNKYKELK